MVLGDPGRIEAEPFGVDDLRGCQPVPLGGVRLIEKAREKTQAFRQRRDRHLPAIMHHRDRVRDLLGCQVIVFFRRQPDLTSTARSTTSPRADAAFCAFTPRASPTREWRIARR
jgi:hypothetical protein